MNALAAAHRAPPANIEAEQALLGAILLNNEAWFRVSGFLTPEHFVEPVHRRIFATIGEMIAGGQKASPVTIKSFLPSDLAIGDLSIPQYLARLAFEATTVVNAPDYARAVFDLAIRRQIIGITDDLSALAYDSPFSASPADQIADAELQLMQMSEAVAAAASSGQGDGQDYDSIIGETEERMRTGRHLRGATTGLASIDYRTGGFAPGEMTILAARPSMGKSALAVAMARRMAHLGVGVAFDTLEMSEAALRVRLLADECESMGIQIPYDRIIKGKISEAERLAIRKAAERLHGMPLAIIDRGMRLADLPTHVRQARRDLKRLGADLQVFFVDYLGLLMPGDRYKGNKVHEVGEKSAFVKAIARRERIAMVALHQLNRANEAREDRRPRLSDLRDSGDLEQDADVVMFVHREAYYLKKSGHGAKDETERLSKLADAENVMEIIIDKQRQGPTGTVTLWCDMALNAVRDRAT